MSEAGVATVALPHGTLWRAGLPKAMKEEALQ